MLYSQVITQHTHAPDIVPYLLHPSVNIKPLAQIKREVTCKSAGSQFGKDKTNGGHMQGTWKSAGSLKGVVLVCRRIRGWQASCGDGGILVL
jgi:hypothetical protein